MVKHFIRYTPSKESRIHYQDKILKNVKLNTIISLKHLKNCHCFCIIQVDTKAFTWSL